MWPKLEHAALDCRSHSTACRHAGSDPDWFNAILNLVVATYLRVHRWVITFCQRIGKTMGKTAGEITWHDDRHYWRIEFENENSDLNRESTRMSHDESSRSAPWVSIASRMILMMQHSKHGWLAIDPWLDPANGRMPAACGSVLYTWDNLLIGKIYIDKKN